MPIPLREFPPELALIGVGILAVYWLFWFIFLRDK